MFSTHDDSMPVPDLTHIFSPGDHYSPKTGSSVPTVIYELMRHHEKAGGHATIIVGRGTKEGFPPYPVGDCVEVNYLPFPKRGVRLMDSLLGAAGLSRPSKWRCYGDALSAIPEDYSGWILNHGEPAIDRPLKAARPRAKVALYCHYDLFRWYTRPEVRKIVDSTDAVVCVSEHICRYVASKYGGRPPHIQAVHNGIDLERFKPPATPPEGDPVILFVGRLHPDKGPDLLIKAALLLKQRGRKFKLRIVGGMWLAQGVSKGPYEQQLQEMARELGDNLDLIPFVDRANMPSVYQQATIFCVPSVWPEPCALTLFEGLGTGLAMVVSRTGGTPEVVADAALIFDPPNHEAFADHLDRLLTDVAMRASYQKAARQRAENLSWGHSYERLMQVLNAISPPQSAAAQAAVAG